jgi:RNA polymerase sigma factor (sigma-70 family)
LTSTPTAVPQYDAESYRTTLIHEVARRVVFLRDVPIHQREDVAQMTVEAFLRNPDGIRARYPEPGVWAGLKLAAMAVDARRREGAQCGTGARHTRRVDVFDPNDPVTQAILTDDTDPVERFLIDEQLAPLLSILSPEDRYLFCMVEGLQYTAREVAGILGIGDSAASRRLTRIRRDLRAYAVAA